ncbi:MAG TPA: SRPBCC domain-containing protein [Acidimicrobiia bacterium]|nr:SRPBCC domain-containing protein [Acidimicrobiia bacterium]
MTQNDGSQDAVVIERSFDAPMDLIWQMWTDLTTSRLGTGPTAPPSPGAKMDVRVGGTRLVCMEMQSPAGPMQMWFTGEYREVVENERLVYTESVS